MSRKLRVRENPVSSFIGGIVGLVFIGIGLSANMGGFGSLFALFALIGTVMSFYNAFSDRGIAKEIIEVSDEEPSVERSAEQTESRLARLGELKARGVISAAEYDQRRTAILSEL